MYNDAVDFDQFALDSAETLRAVDDSVGRVVRALASARVLENTLIVRGPLGARGGARLPQMVLNLDIRPNLC